MKNRVMGALLFAIALSSSSVVHALDGVGTVTEFMVCTGDHTGATVSTGWGKLGLFKLSDGNWFGSFMGYYYSTSRDYDDTSIYSTVMYAASSGKQLKVRANYGTYTVCGVSAMFLHTIAGDYVWVIN